MKLVLFIVVLVVSTKYNGANLALRDDDLNSILLQKIDDLAAGLRTEIQNINNRLDKLDTRLEEINTCLGSTCVEEPKCPVIDYFYGGFVDYTGDREVATNAIFTCNADFDLFPDSDATQNIATCKANLEWDFIPECLKRAVIDVENNVKTTCHKTLMHGESCRISCPDKYELRDGEAYVSDVYVTNYNGTLNRTVDQIHCIEKRCDLNCVQYTNYTFKDNSNAVVTGYVYSGTMLHIGCHGEAKLVPDNQNPTVICDKGSIRTITSMCVNETVPVKPEECLVVPYGNIADQGRSIECNPGYSLDNEFYFRFSCECDVHNTKEPFKCVGRKPKCVPDNCKLPSFIEARMTVELVKGRTKKRLLPNDESVRHGAKVVFHCSASGDTVYEPVNRIFRCDKGHWVEMNTEWNFGNDGDFPICREAKCDCKHEGKCVRDDQCDCPRFTMGDQCEEPVCPSPCINNGTCVGPRTCSCVGGFSGDTCETEGCSPPAGLSNVEQKVYVEGSVIDIQGYHCPGDLAPFPKQSIICENSMWSAQIQCLSTILYEITLKTSDRRGAGTEGKPYINIKGYNNRETGRVYFDRCGNRCGTAFGRNGVDTMKLRLIDVGRIRMIELGVVKQNRYGDGWRPSYATIKVPSRVEFYRFEHDESEIDDTSVMLQQVQQVQSTCSEPVVDYGTVVETHEQTKGGYQQSNESHFKMTCDSGYTTEDGYQEKGFTLVCQQNHWVGGIPECKPLDDDYDYDSYSYM